jgi:hypothetical protein
MIDKAKDKDQEFLAFSSIHSISARRCVLDFNQNRHLQNILFSKFHDNFILVYSQPFPNDYLPMV